MRNTLILVHFFEFLNDLDLFVPYLKNAMAIGKRGPTLLHALFFRFEPDIWITGAFSWERDSLNDWRAINELWLERVNALTSKNSLND